MRLSKILLVKDGRKIVLQGTIHLGPRLLYEKLQKNILWHHRRGFQICYESSSYEPSPRVPVLDPSSIETDRLLKVSTQSFAQLALLFKVSVPEEIIRYPKDAVCVDMPRSMLIVGLKPFLSGLNNIIRSINNEAIFLRKQILDMGVDKSFREYLKFIDLDYDHYVERVVYLSGSTNIAPFLHFIVIERDHWVVNIIKSMNTPKKYILFGELHIEGMTRDLIKDGWHIKSKSYIYVEKFLTT